MESALQFGIFYEHQLPRPWHDGEEQRLFHEALERSGGSGQAAMTVLLAPRCWDRGSDVLTP